MKIQPIEKLFTGFLMLIFIANLTGCCEDEPKPSFKFELKMDEYSIKVTPSKSTAGTEFEVWTAKIQNEQYPIALTYGYLDEKCRNYGDYILLDYKQAYFNKYGTYLGDTEKNMYLYFQVRLKNENGFGEFQRYCYKIGVGLVK